MIDQPFIRTIFFCSFSIFAASVLAESAVATVVGNFEEHYSEEVPVSGNVIAGVMLASQEQSVDFSPHIVGHSRKNNSDSLVCLSIVSQDGTYSSRNTFKLPDNPTSKLIPVDYTQSRYRDVLSKDITKHLAIKAQYGKCGSETLNQYLISTTDGVYSSIKTLVIKIDSLGATAIKTAARTTQREILKGECTSIAEDRKTGYDFTCSIPLSKAINDPLEVEVRRKRFGRMMQSIRFKVQI